MSESKTQSGRHLFGVIAKHADSRLRLVQQFSEILPPRFPSKRSSWWIDPAVGLGICGDLVRKKPYQSDTPTPIISWIYGHPLTSGPAPDVNSISASPDFFSNGHPDSLQHLAGAFAVASWDGTVLTVARDPLGQTALYVRDHEEFLFFSTSLVSLLQDARFRCALDIESSFNYLAFGTPGKGRTLAQGVSAVPAGHYLRWCGKEVPTRHMYFSALSLCGEKVGSASLNDAIQQAVDSAISRRLSSQGSGLLLSSGVDSSYIAAYCEATGKAGQLRAYTIRFTAKGALNEDEAAADFAAALGVQHQVVPLDEVDALSHLHSVLSRAEPASTWSAIAHMHLLNAAKADGLTHMLSGLGADEIFGGYYGYLHYYRMAREFIDKRLSAEMDPFDLLIATPSEARRRLFPGIARFLTDRRLRESLEEPYSHFRVTESLQSFYRQLRLMKPQAHLFEMMVAHECQNRIPDLLLRSFESASVSNQVSTDYPFLDSQVVKLGCSLGAAERYWLEGKRWRGKKLFREIASRRLPGELLKAKPIAFNAPFSLWMNDKVFRQRTREMINDSSLWNLRLLKRSYLDKLEHMLANTNRVTSKHLLWQEYWIVLTLASWTNTFCN